MRVWFPLSVFAAALALSLTLGYATGEEQPGLQSTPLAAAPQSVWTPTANAPRDLLTPLEGERHDRFIASAQKGDIDIVFFGSTETEMWLWQDRGRSVWDQTFGSLKAVDFGTQGTRFESLLWRMRNGELNGYKAKLIVLQAQGDDDTAIRNGKFDDYVANYAAIIAEIRARQPQARILLFGCFPRNEAHTGLQANAALGKLANNETVFFIDLSDRFFRPDGSHNSEMWTFGITDPGIKAPAFKVWAEALQPWLDRFVR